MTDNHLHTEFSWDSALNAAPLIEKAIALGYTGITITEHLDLLPQEFCEYGAFALQRYREHLAKLRAMYPQITLQTGLEIGDYHLVRDFATALLRYAPVDFVIGSVHFLADGSNVAIPLPEPLSPEQQMDYYRQNLALVTDTDIDVLGHLGVYKRYYRQMPEESHCRDIIRRIFAVMISRGIALELNYSAFRKDYRRLLPEPEYVDLFQSMGGKRFSIGSDSHHEQHFHDHYDKLPEFMKHCKVGEKNILICE